MDMEKFDAAIDFCNEKGTIQIDVKNNKVCMTFEMLCDIIYDTMEKGQRKNLIMFVSELESERMINVPYTNQKEG